MTGASIKDCLQAASTAFGIPVALLRRRTRAPAISHPRQAAMWLARTQGHSYPEIGRALGFDHTTVMYGCRAVENRAGRDSMFGDRIQSAWDKMSQTQNARPGSPGGRF